MYVTSPQPVRSVNTLVKAFSPRWCASRDSTNQNALFVEGFLRLGRAVFRAVYGEIFALFQACVVISPPYGLGKLMEHAILKIPSVLGIPFSYYCSVFSLRGRRSKEKGKVM